MKITNFFRSKFTLLLLMAFVLAIGSGFKGCGGKVKVDGFKPNKAELGQDWKQFKHDTSFNVWVFKDDQPRPAEHKTPLLASVFWDGEVTAVEKSLIDTGLTETLAACKLKSAEWFSKPIWDTFYFRSVADYKVLQVPSNYTLQEGEAAGCAGLIIGPHGVYRAAGTVGGLNDRWKGSSPGGEGGVYILIAKQSPEQLARAECRQLMKDAVRNEAEHVVFSNVPQIYFAFANDGAEGVGNHPYCTTSNAKLWLLYRRWQREHKDEITRDEILDSELIE